MTSTIERACNIMREDTSIRPGRFKPLGEITQTGYQITPFMGTVLAQTHYTFTNCDLILSHRGVINC